MEGAVEKDGKGIEEDTDSKGVGKNASSIEAINKTDDDEKKEGVKSIQREADGVPEKIFAGVSFCWFCRVCHF